MSETRQPPQVAVIIPCYNHARTLPATVASVVGQTYPSWEIIIIDDGSADGSAQVAEQLIERFSTRCIRLIQQPNGGQGAARNRGIAATSAPYILPLDADDLIDAHTLERMVALIEADSTCGFVTANARFFGEETGIWSGGEPSLERMRFDCRTTISALFRRQAWAAVCGFDEDRAAQGYEDWDFWLRLIEGGWHGTHLPAMLIWYRRSASGQLTRATREDLRFRAQMVHRHPTLYPPAFRPWAMAVLGGWPSHSAARWWGWYAWYSALVGRHAPHELPKTLLRPAFKAIGPHAQMYARRLAQAIGVSRRA
ncbi:glycosyltransferase family 2 protein [Chloroflexia bacterium SDU3-3]|nr:glycosyltransferase family 2 protein [Chloroflexia bacterium SDU3-3]